MKNKIKHYYMTNEEARKYYGVELYEKMCETGLLDNITCEINKEGKLIIYACDLHNAYNKVINNKVLFVD